MIINIHGERKDIKVPERGDYPYHTSSRLNMSSSTVDIIEPSPFNHFFSPRPFKQWGFPLQFFLESTVHHNSNVHTTHHSLYLESSNILEDSSIHRQRGQLPALATGLDKGPVRDSGTGTHWSFPTGSSLPPPYRAPGLGHLPTLPQR